MIVQSMQQQLQTP